MEKMTLTIKGTSPLLMHNGQLCDPMNEHARALSAAVKEAKAKKTDDAWVYAHKCEFLGGLYLDDALEPCITGESLEAMICAGAKATKQGKAVKAGIMVDGNFSLDYKGPRTADGLWDARFFKTQGARVGQNRVMRTRPCFTGWACTFDIHYNPTLINKGDIRKFIARAGEECGIGDYRPRFGRFEVA